MTGDVENTPEKKCAICARPAVERYRPFCSKRCADIDLNRWLKGGYVIPAAPDDAPESKAADAADDETH